MTTKKLNRLAELRYTKGFTIRGLAQAANVVPSTVYKIEHGSPGSLGSLAKLAKVLEVSLTDLLDLAEGFTDSPKQQAATLATR